MVLSLAYGSRKYKFQCNNTNTCEYEKYFTYANLFLKNNESK